MKFHKIKLLTTDLNVIVEFYQNTLGFETVQQEETIEIKIGRSILAFEKTTDHQKPFYHYALNIPTNQFEEAKNWLSQFVELVSHQNSTTIDFPNWNAQSVYFYDTAGNMGELIARHDLEVMNDAPFSAQSIIEISEIGLVSNDLLALATTLQTNLNAPIYKANSKVFYPIGDENGLLICVPKGRIWYLTDIPADLFPVEITIESDHFFDFTQENYRFKSVVLPNEKV